MRIRAEQWLKALGIKFPAPPEELDVEAGRKAAHFAAWEQPELFSEEVRSAFKSLRGDKATALNQ